MTRTLSRVVLYLLLIAGAIVMLFPFIWMILSAFKTASEVASTPPTLLPSAFRLDNFIAAFAQAPFGAYFVNSVLITIVCVVVTQFTTVLAAFAFARLSFRGRDTLFVLSLALMMVPFELLIITNYSTIADLRLIDTLPALALPFTASVLYTYVMRNTFLAVPESLYWSARVDGASNWRYLWKVLVPISQPTLVTTALLNAIVCWNSFLWPLLVINSTSNRTLPLGLYSFITESGVRYEVLMAASTIAVLPMLVLFAFGSKFIIRGISRGGLKS